MKPGLGVGAVVLRDFDGELQVCLVRRANPPNEGSWSLPGGRVEWGESLERAVCREVLEETSLRVVVTQLLELVELISDAHHYVVVDYLCKLDAKVVGQQHLEAGDDASDVCWLAVGELAKKRVSAAVTRVVGRAVAVWRDEQQASACC